MEKREGDGTFVLIVAVLRLLQWIFDCYWWVRVFVWEMEVAFVYEILSSNRIHCLY